MDRKDVYLAFDSERDYQMRRWGIRQRNGTFKEAPHSVEEFILYMEDYLDEARHQASRSGDLHPSLESLRKVATLAIACFEQHGVQKREGGDVTNGWDGLPA